MPNYWEYEKNGELKALEHNKMWRSTIIWQRHKGKKSVYVNLMGRFGGRRFLEESDNIRKTYSKYEELPAFAGTQTKFPNKANE